MTDANFNAGGEQPVRLYAESAEDLRVVSALAQDAITRTDRIAWTPRTHRFTVLLNRFRWEDAERATRDQRAYERVQTLLVVGSVLRARHAGVATGGPARILSLLALSFEPGTDGAGILRFTFAGGAEIALEVECVDLSLLDVTQPYEAVSDEAPDHDAD